jgi:hypothetical protein
MLALLAPLAGRSQAQEYVERSKTLVEMPPQALEAVAAAAAKLRMPRDSLVSLILRLRCELAGSGMPSGAPFLTPEPVSASQSEHATRYVYCQQPSTNHVTEQEFWRVWNVRAIGVQEPHPSAQSGLEILEVEAFLTSDVGGQEVVRWGRRAFFPGQWRLLWYERRPTHR